MRSTPRWPVVGRGEGGQEQAAEQGHQTAPHARNSFQSRVVSLKGTGLWSVRLRSGKESLEAPFAAGWGTLSATKLRSSQRQPLKVRRCGGPKQARHLRRVASPSFGCAARLSRLGTGGALSWGKDTPCADHLCGCRRLPGQGGDLSRRPPVRDAGRGRRQRSVAGAG